MLARIGEKHVRLSRVPEGGGAGTASGPWASLPHSSVLDEIEKERARIARELHAGAGQPLASIKANLDLLEAWSKSMPEEVRQTIVRLNHLAEAALAQVRAVSHRLHPPDWQELSLAEALQSLVDESGVTGKLEAEVNLGPLPIEPPQSAKVVLYRCAQECVSNVLRHSGATRFSLVLSEGECMVHMAILDNGTGIPEDARAGGGGIGLTSIREHAGAAGGILRISSGSEGTAIEISLPLTED
jgi:signal transduction histidine kinase